MRTSYYAFTELMEPDETYLNNEQQQKLPGTQVIQLIQTTLKKTEFVIY